MIYRFDTTPIKISIAFFTEIEKNPKIRMEPQKPQIAKVILRKKNKAGGIILPDFKPYYKAIVIKTVYGIGIGLKTDT